VNWTKLLANKEAQRHRTSKTELDNMRALIARDLTDAALVGLSADRRFATAYNAALQAANMVIACAGYRIVSKTGHHRISLESTKLVLATAAHKYADYFETCRRKRNNIDYTLSNVATETEANEILIQTREFYAHVEAWITRNRPALKKK
jgi:allantoicase